MREPKQSSPRCVLMTERRFWRLLNQMYEQGFEDRATEKASHSASARKEAVDDARAYLRRTGRVVFIAHSPR